MKKSRDAMYGGRIKSINVWGKKEVNMEDEKVENVGGDNQAKPMGETNSFDEVLNGNKDFQAEFDRRINKAVETAKSKMRETLDTEKSEAERLAKMNNIEKLEYQLKKAQEEKDGIVAKLNAYELKQETTSYATEKGLDISLLELIDFKNSNAEDAKSKVDNMVSLFNKAIEKAVNNKLKEDAPITNTNGVDKKMPKTIPLIF